MGLCVNTLLHHTGRVEFSKMQCHFSAWAHRAVARSLRRFTFKKNNCLNTEFVGTRWPSVLLCPGAYNAVKTVLVRWPVNVVIFRDKLSQKTALVRWQVNAVIFRDQLSQLCENTVIIFYRVKLCVICVKHYSGTVFYMSSRWTQMCKNLEVSSVGWLVNSTLLFYRVELIGKTFKNTAIFIMLLL